MAVRSTRTTGARQTVACNCFHGERVTECDWLCTPTARGSVQYAESGADRGPRLGAGLDRGAIGSFVRLSEASVWQVPAR